jgi:BlaI family transcriptional regulator, penicillinase repressor
MPSPKLTKLELRIMEVLWSRGPISIREVQEAFPKVRRPAYSTIQTTIYRLEKKKSVRRIRKIGNAHIFEALISRSSAQRRFIDELLSLFGGMQPVMEHLVDSGRLSLDDVHEAERALQRLAGKEKPE